MISERIVTGVAKGASAHATHEHISEVSTQGAIHYTRQEVIESIEAGDRWRTLADGIETETRVIESCPHPGCTLGPYIQSNPDATGTDNLQNLPLR